MPTATLSPYFLQSTSSLTQFLSGRSEVATIEHTLPTPHTPLQSHSWNRCIDPNWLFYIVSEALLTTSSYLLYALCMTDLSKKVWVYSHHALNNAAIIQAEKVFHKAFLVKSVNSYRLDGAPEYLLPPVATSLPTHPNPGILQFFHPKGICRGICYWFVHLCFKTQGKFENADEHLIALGKQFEEGAPAQAVLLQALHPCAVYDLLHLNVREDFLKIAPRGKTDEQIVAELHGLPPGMHGIYLSNHMLVYRKIDETRQYLFDPSIGTFNVRPRFLFKKALERYLNSHDRSQEICVDLYTP